MKLKSKTIQVSHFWFLIVSFKGKRRTNDLQSICVGSSSQANQNSVKPASLL